MHLYKLYLGVYKRAVDVEAKHVSLKRRGINVIKSKQTKN